MTTNTNSPAPAIPQPAGDREAGLPPGSASRTLRERVADAIRKQIRVDVLDLSTPRVGCRIFGMQDAADAAIAEVMAWQPIETAPKDASRILLGSADWYGDIIIGSWSFGAWREKADPNAIAYQPRVWMPLPSPPNKGEK